MRYFFYLLILLGGSNALAVSSILPEASSTSTTLPRPEFMDLYEDFIQYSSDPSKMGIGQTLTQILDQSKAQESSNAPLILIVNSDLYVYDSQRKKLLYQAIRAEKDSGFFELTAISHIGPALSYLLAIKNNGGDWKTLMKDLQLKIQAAQKANTDTTHPWLKEVDAPAWQPYLNQIQAMNQYGLDMSNAFIDSILTGKSDFNDTTINDEFLSGNESYPIPFNNVMVGTFMLTTLNEMVSIYLKLKALNLDWENSRVIIRFVAGSNLTAGLTVGSNWLVDFLENASEGRLPTSSIFIIPFAEIKESVGKDEMTTDDFNYYVNVLWGSAKQRNVANKVFTSIPNIYVSDRVSLPGDYGITSKDDIEAFNIRLKYSLATPTQMLSNSTAFWMAGELANKDWDYKKIDIPGLTTGFPTGIKEYPAPK